MASCILTAEVMEEVGTLKCISESWELISTAAWNLSPSCQAVLCVGHFQQKDSAFNTHPHLFTQFLIKKLINQSMMALSIRPLLTRCAWRWIRPKPCPFLFWGNRGCYDLPHFCSTSVLQHRLKIAQALSQEAASSWSVLQWHYLHSISHTWNQ